MLSYYCFFVVYGLSETGLITGCYEGAFKLGSSGVLTIGTRLKVCILTFPVRSIKKCYNSETCLKRPLKNRLNKGLKVMW